ncbi:hypothetical protein OS493_040179, partial [Desmophyllum pertusum]
YETKTVNLPPFPSSVQIVAAPIACLQTNFLYTLWATVRKPFPDPSRLLSPPISLCPSQPLRPSPSPGYIVCAINSNLHQPIRQVLLVQQGTYSLLRTAICPTSTLSM